MSKAIIETECYICGQQYSIEVNKECYDAWQKGLLDDDVLRDVSDEDRELLVTKTCDSCWQILFPKGYPE